MMECAICGKWFSSSNCNHKLCIPCQRKKDAAKTNADRIRAMSDEELSELLAKRSLDDMNECDDAARDRCEQYGHMPGGGCFECLKREAIDWLSQPAEED